MSASDCVFFGPLEAYKGGLICNQSFTYSTFNTHIRGRALIVPEKFCHSSVKVGARLFLEKSPLDILFCPCTNSAPFCTLLRFLFCSLSLSLSLSLSGNKASYIGCVVVALLQLREMSLPFRHDQERCECVLRTTTCRDSRKVIFAALSKEHSTGA